MAGTTTLKLTNRSPKQPVKRLPANVEIPAGATVEDVKKAVAKQAKIGDHNRVGLFDTVTRKTFKDRHAVIMEIPAVADSSEVLVKDLGPQIGWRTVFLIEYFGPILFHCAVVAARPYIYKGGDADMSKTQWLVFGMFIAHFLKREFETAFIHKFSASTMPFFNVFRNSFFYWAISGFLCSLSIYYPNSLAARADQPMVDALGLALFVFSETGNALIHYYLSTLRAPGSTERKIPRGYGFGIVTCPNYMFEIMAWIGVIIVSRDWSVVLFITIGSGYMYTWAKGKERAYRTEFGDKYKNKRYLMLPGLV